MPFDKRLLSHPKLWLLLFGFVLLGVLVGVVVNWQISNRSVPRSTLFTTVRPPSVNYVAPPYRLVQPIDTAILKSPGNQQGGATNSENASPQTLGASSSPWADLTLYLDPEAASRTAPSAWRSTRPRDVETLIRLALVPSAIWFGDWNTHVFTDARQRLAGMTSSQVAVLAVYNLPHRDCGGYSSGGAKDETTYNTWINQLSVGIGEHNAIVILEPDALADMECLSPADRSARYAMLRNAVNIFSRKSNVRVYLDAGNSQWHSAAAIADRLHLAGIDQADGFSLNVSNFLTTNSEIAYGSQISAKVKGKHFLIDTSRNGRGPAASYEWCNPSGRAVGAKPTLDTDNSLVDGYLWIKTPGESDGECNGGPAAGEWWPDYALGLATRGGI